jgi:hypothetical protein
LDQPWVQAKKGQILNNPSGGIEVTMKEKTNPSGGMNVTVRE